MKTSFYQERKVRGVITRGLDPRMGPPGWGRRAVRGGCVPNVERVRCRVNAGSRGFGEVPDRFIPGDVTAPAKLPFAQAMTNVFGPSDRLDGVGDLKSMKLCRSGWHERAYEVVNVPVNADMCLVGHLEFAKPPRGLDRVSSSVDSRNAPCQ